MKAAEKEPKRKTPWRDNIEAMAMAVVMALLLKYFIIEAYKIPSGSMQPALLGGLQVSYEKGFVGSLTDKLASVFGKEPTRRGVKVVNDRILVDKLSFRFRDPERFEVVVFRYPLDRSKNFVKRIVGMPGEHFRIEAGDLWTRGEKGEAWQPLRRPAKVQREAWKPLDPEKPETSSWSVIEGGQDWLITGRQVWARGGGTARFRSDQISIMDDYSDGYPESLGRVRSATATTGENPVGDLRLEGLLTARDGCERVTLELTEGEYRHVFSLPGPAAEKGAQASLATYSASQLIEEVPLEGFEGLELGEEHAFAAQNMDDLLQLELDGQVVGTLEVASVREQLSSVQIRVEGDADFEELMVSRDIYYTVTSQGEWQIPERSYFMLGDNTQDSSDSREWNFTHFEVRQEDGTLVDVRGNTRNNENPRTDVNSREYLFVDEFGERHRFPIDKARRSVEPEPAPFVPRSMIQGRALAVFWPLSPSLSLYRLKWIN